MEDQSEGPTGRDAVRTLLIEPLEVAGLVRQRNVKAAVHDAAVQKMIERLAYMRPDRLVTLCEAVIDNATGDRANRWPAYATVWNWARRLQSPPDDERHIMNSWLRSVEGPIASAGGYLAELYLWLRKHGRPPSVFELEKIKGEAEDRNRRRARGDEQDRDEMEYFARVERHCLDLVESGDVRRAGEHEG
jgi:hypothetical protein